ncbi:hypothetical protein MRX96_030978 [Rhipicephalus microplus]
MPGFALSGDGQPSVVAASSAALSVAGSAAGKRNAPDGGALLLPIGVAAARLRRPGQVPPPPQRERFHCHRACDTTA